MDHPLGESADAMPLPPAARRKAILNGPLTGLFRPGSILISRNYATGPTAVTQARAGHTYGTTMVIA